MQRSPRASAQRTLRRAVTWQPKRRGSEPLSITRLISPLRYDVLVRARFFDFLGARPQDESFADMVEAAWVEPYGTWFQSVAMPRFRPWVLKDEQVLRRTFAERVRSARDLQRSFAERGFDPRSPVTLQQAVGPRLTDTGIPVSRELHVGDGGHRLALLLHAGCDLQPGMYRVDPRQRPLIDNTSILIRELGMDAGEYLRFVSAGYTDRTCRDVADLRAVVVAESPDSVAELDAVLAAHRRLMGVA